jgi:hypothetical protein
MLPSLQTHVTVLAIVIVCYATRRNSHVLPWVFAVEWHYLPVIGMRFCTPVQVAELVYHFWLTANQVYKILGIQIIFYCARSSSLACDLFYAWRALSLNIIVIAFVASKRLLELHCYRL